MTISDHQLTIYCDGGARGNPGPAAAAFVVSLANGEVVYKQGKYLGTATNNQAEYAAVNMALRWVGQNHPDSEIKLVLDSLLVANQLTGLYKVKDRELKIKNGEVKELIKNFKLRIIDVIHVGRKKNFLADTLVNQTIDLYNLA